jgi:hypothetical protein
MTLSDRESGRMCPDGGRGDGGRTRELVAVLMIERPHVQVRRIYDDPTPSDRTCVLVDRIWPRG